MKNASKIKADLINDVSGLSYDPETINYLKKTKKPFVIHHMKGTPKNMQLKNHRIIMYCLIFMISLKLN